MDCACKVVSRSDFDLSQSGVLHGQFNVEWLSLELHDDATRFSSHDCFHDESLFVD